MSKQKFDFAVGGQALIEGVMIRSPHFISIAVRRPDGAIVVKKDAFRSISATIKIFKLPILRGMLNLIEMLVYGMKAINYSAEQAFEEEPKSHDEKTAMQKIITTASFVISFILSIALALFLFKFIPLFITTQLEKFFPALKTHYILFNTIDGLIRISMFIGYIYFLSKWKYFHRVFEYHGAEHQAVFAYEKNKPLTVEQVQPESPCHPRCGTSFIMIVLIISILLFTLMPRHPDFWINFSRRLSIIPFIAGIGYEILKWAGKHQAYAMVRALSKPGLWTQKITTSTPDTGQIEVAIKALSAALEAEHAMRGEPRQHSHGSQAP